MEKGVIIMKKFLVSFIIGVVMMAIGTTSLIFEIGQFEHVNAVDVLANHAYGYRNEVFDLKNDKDVVELVLHDDYYGHSYEYNYDDSLKDRVKITLSGGVSYSVSGSTIDVSKIDDEYYYGYENDFTRSWNRIEFFLDGLKERKIYEMGYDPIIITTSYSNKDRVRIITNN